MMDSGGMLHYLGLFIFYTLVAIAIIYGLFWFIRKNPAVLQLGKKSLHSKQAPLEIEQVLPLEPRKNLYIIRAGHERFLVATSMESTQFLSRLEETPKPEEIAQAETPSDSSGNAQTLSLEPGAPTQAEPTLQGRLMQSLRWITASRFKLLT